MIIGKRFCPTRLVTIEPNARAWRVAVSRSTAILDTCCEVVPLEVSSFTIMFSGALRSVEALEQADRQVRQCGERVRRQGMTAVDVVEHPPV